MTEPQTPVGDLARQLLRQQIADAKRRGATTKAPRPKRKRARYNDGRDPKPLESVLEQLADTHGWKRPSTAGRIAIAWERLMGERAGRIAPARFDAEARVLHLRPASPAAGAWARLNAPRILEVLRAEFGTDAPNDLRILAPGPIETPALERPAAPRPTLPARVRPTPAPKPAGYLEARAANDAARAAAEDPRRELRDRYFADIRNTLREPVEAFVDNELLERKAASATAAEEVRQRAIEAARAQKAGQPIPGVRRLADTA